MSNTTRKKKAYQAMMHTLTVEQGLGNNPDGRMVPRGSQADNSMRRDYYPQQRKKGGRKA